MRYGVIPTRLIEWLALRLGKAPLPVFDSLLAPVQARALIAAQRAGVLKELGRAPASTDALARALSLDAECLGLVLRLLRAMGYVERRPGDLWRLTRLGVRHFGARASSPCDAFVEYGPTQWAIVEQLDKVLASGRGIDFHDHQTPAQWDAYQRAMFENAASFAAFLVDEVPVRSGATRCVDVAGSHGFVGAALCQKYRGLASTVLDRPEALNAAQAIALQHGYQHLVRFEACDILRDALGERVDVSLLCNILHHFSADQNRAVLARVRRSMAPDGTVAIFEIETPDPDAAPDAIGDGFALYFRISSTSTCFRGEGYASWLREAGFERVRVVRSLRMPSRVLVTARAPRRE